MLFVIVVSLVGNLKVLVFFCSGINYSLSALGPYMNLSIQNFIFLLEKRKKEELGNKKN